MCFAHGSAFLEWGFDNRTFELMRLLSTLFFSLALFSFAVSQAQRPEAIPGDILVMLMPGASPQQIVDNVARLDRGASGLHVEREISAPMRT